MDPNSNPLNNNSQTPPRPESTPSSITSPIATQPVQQPNGMNISHDLTQSPQLGSPKAKSKLPIIIGTIFVVLLVSGGLFALLSRNSEDPASSNNATPGSSVSEQEPLEDAQTREQREISLDKTVSEGVLDVTLNSVVRDYKPKEPLKFSEVILVKVTIRMNSPEYSMTVGSSAVELLVDGKNVDQVPMRQELSAAGFAHMEPKTIKSGESVSGYIAFQIPLDAKEIILSYDQSGRSIIKGPTDQVDDIKLEIPIQE